MEILEPNGWYSHLHFRDVCNSGIRKPVTVPENKFPMLYSNLLVQNFISHLFMSLNNLSKCQTSFYGFDPSFSKFIIEYFFPMIKFKSFYTIG